MVVCRSAEQDYLMTFDNGRAQAIADVPQEHGGTGQGFRPHDLLEAALGNCLAMTARMYAKRKGMALTGVKVTVNLDRSQEGKAQFTYTVELSGALSAEDKEKVLRVIKNCPVHKTLTSEITISQSEG